MKKVVCFGEILWDMFPGGKKPGGAPMNVAFHLQKQGIKSTLISAIGEDDNGQALLAHLVANSIDTTFVQRHPVLPTGTVDVTLDGEGKATYIINQPVSWDAISFNHSLTDLVAGADALAFGSLASRAAISASTLAELLRAASYRVFDMNLRPPHVNLDVLERLLGNTNLLKINDEELVYLRNTFNLPGDDHKALMALSDLFSIPSVCLTRGAQGAVLLHEKLLTSHPGFKVQVVDTVGAGDAFLATLVDGILNGSDIQKTLIRANAIGALVASKAGANPEYSENEINGLTVLI